MSSPLKIIDSIPSVYTGNSFPPPEGFNAVILPIDARLDSDLKWNEQKKQAGKYIAKHIHILWHLKLGLFNELHLPLSDTSQYKSLNLAIDYFFETLFAEFKNHTLGVALYSGTLDFTHGWHWLPDQVLNFRGWLSDLFKSKDDFSLKLGLPCASLMQIEPQELLKTENGKNLLRFYCSRAAFDYFSMLSSRFEMDLLPHIMLDLTSIKSPTHAFQLLDHEDFEFIQLVLKNSPFISQHAMGWDSSALANGYFGKELKTFIPLDLEPQVGVVIPSNLICDQKVIDLYDQVIQTIGQKKNYRLLSEKNITLDWAGLEEMVVIDVDLESKRKLEGFIAAGGKVVAYKPLHLSEEESYLEFTQRLGKS